MNFLLKPQHCQKQNAKPTKYNDLTSVSVYVNLEENEKKNQQVRLFKNQECTF